MPVFTHRKNYRSLASKINAQRCKGMGGKQHRYDPRMERATVEPEETRGTRGALHPWRGERAGNPGVSHAEIKS